MNIAVNWGILPFFVSLQFGHAEKHLNWAMNQIPWLPGKLAVRPWKEPSFNGH